jgi:hypothetical protein
MENPWQEIYPRSETELRRRLRNAPHQEWAGEFASQDCHQPLGQLSLRGRDFVRESRIDLERAVHANA